MSPHHHLMSFPPFNFNFLVFTSDGCHASFDLELCAASPHRILVRETAGHLARQLESCAHSHSFLGGLVRPFQAKIRRFLERCEYRVQYYRYLTRDVLYSGGRIKARENAVVGHGRTESGSSYLVPYSQYLVCSCTSDGG